MGGGRGDAIHLKQTGILRSIPRVGTQKLVKIITGNLIINLRRYEPFEDKCDAREEGRHGDIIQCVTALRCVEILGVSVMC